MTEFGLCNPALDAQLENEIREGTPNMSDTAVIMEMNRIKKEMTLFNAANSKSNSSRRPPVVGKPEEIPNGR